MSTDGDKNTDSDLSDAMGSLQQLNIGHRDDMSKCSACGKVDDGLKMFMCNRCKMVKYCNATCQKAHWPKHKKECSTSDDDLFKQPPPRGECPVCLLTLPVQNKEKNYQACCGKDICIGCCDAIEKVVGRQENLICPFCRAPVKVSNGVWLERMKKRVEANDAGALCHMGWCYSIGSNGLPRDLEKANELWLRAGALGNAMAYCHLGHSYLGGRGGNRIGLDKANHYLELAAMGGVTNARYNLGTLEKNAGNIKRALKHFMVSVGDGDDDSLAKIRELFMGGYATKNDFEKALRAHQAAKDEMRSDERDVAAAARGRTFDESDVRSETCLLM
mgnify:CR=1 FL=1